MIQSSPADVLSLPVKLCPAQQQAFEGLARSRTCGNLFVLSGAEGCGRTTVARALAREMEARYLGAAELHKWAMKAHPLGIEEAWTESILGTLKENHRLVVDDFDAAEFLMGSCHSYPRPNHFDTGVTAIADEVHRLNGWILFVGSGGSSTLSCQAIRWPIGRFTIRDQEFLFRAHYSQESVASLDFSKIFRFAPRLSARQIARSAKFMDRDGLTTEGLLEYLRSQDLVTNVDLGEVEKVELRDLQGVDGVLERLEAHIVIPLENDELSKKLNLVPRRGVLLYGPPGTGKTTVGRALAHRLKSKFFLIDGTFVSGSSSFYNNVIRVFELAKRNAPAVVFIDDSDVIFESGEDFGFYRYLLTILDGVESEEAGRLTVMMTAMDVAKLPPALIRSGRIELWLEMKLPDAPARRHILEQRFEKSVPEKFPVEWDRLVEATDGFTGADLRRLVEDGKNLWGQSIVKGRSGDPNESFLLAAEEISAGRIMLAKAHEAAILQQPPRPRGFRNRFEFPMHGGE